MNKVVVAGGIVVLVLGIILTAFASIPISEIKTEPYQVPQSTVIIDHFGPTLSLIPVPTTDWTDGFSFDAGDLLNIEVNVTSGGIINFYVDDGSKGVSGNLDSAIYLSYPNITSLNTDWVVPKNSSYNFVFNTLGKVSANDVHWQIVKHWNETDYRSVTQNVPLLPIQVLYIGVGTALSGLAITVYGVSLKKRQIRS
jgi:hypothetical protein